MEEFQSSFDKWCTRRGEPNFVINASAHEDVFTAMDMQISPHAIIGVKLMEYREHGLLKQYLLDSTVIKWKSRHDSVKMEEFQSSFDKWCTRRGEANFVINASAHEDLFIAMDMQISPHAIIGVKLINVTAPLVTCTTDSDTPMLPSAVSTLHVEEKFVQDNETKTYQLKRFFQHTRYVLLKESCFVAVGALELLFQTWCKDEFISSFRISAPEFRDVLKNFDVSCDVLTFHNVRINKEEFPLPHRWSITSFEHLGSEYQELWVNGIRALDDFSRMQTFRKLSLKEQVIQIPDRISAVMPQVIDYPRVHMYIAKSVHQECGVCGVRICCSSCTPENGVTPLPDILGVKWCGVLFPKKLQKRWDFDTGIYDESRFCHVCSPKCERLCAGLNYASKIALDNSESGEMDVWCDQLYIVAYLAEINPSDIPLQKMLQSFTQIYFDPQPISKEYCRNLVATIPAKNDNIFSQTNIFDRDQLLKMYKLCSQVARSNPPTFRRSNHLMLNTLKNLFREKKYHICCNMLKNVHLTFETASEKQDWYDFVEQVVDMFGFIHFADPTSLLKPLLLAVQPTALIPKMMDLLPKDEPHTIYDFHFVMLPFHWAIQEGRLDMLDKYGFTHPIVNNRQYQSILHIAAQTSKLAFSHVVVIISKYHIGALETMFWQKDEFGFTPIDYAVKMQKD